MRQIERYIFRIALGATLACLIGLTGTIWLTQALRELDLVTAKGQTLLVFLFVTGLSLPTLVVVIAPVALFIGTIYALNKLNGDSELIVMSAAGMPPRSLLRPFLTLALFVSFLVGFLVVVVMPASFQELRDVITRVRGDFIANVVKEGQFTQLDNGITFHFRERGPGGTLKGLFIQDRREAGKTKVYLAERGNAADVDGQSYLILENGSVHQQQKDSRDSSILTFERYTIDLAAFAPPDSDTIYKPRERSTAQLLFPDTTEGYYKLQKGRFGRSCTTGFPPVSTRWPWSSSPSRRWATHARHGRGAASRSPGRSSPWWPCASAASRRSAPPRAARRPWGWSTACRFWRSSCRAS